MTTEALKITANEAREASPRLRITGSDIARFKERFIKENLLLSFEEAGQLLGKSARHVQELAKDGKLVVADAAAVKPGRKGAVLTAGSRVTAESVEIYRQSIEVPREKWGE